MLPECFVAVIFRMVHFMLGWRQCARRKEERRTNVAEGFLRCGYGVADSATTVRMYGVLSIRIIISPAACHGARSIGLALYFTKAVI